MAHVCFSKVSDDGSVRCLEADLFRRSQGNGVLSAEAPRDTDWRPKLPATWGEGMLCLVEKQI